MAGFTQAMRFSLSRAGVFEELFRIKREAGIRRGPASFLPYHHWQAIQ